ncbi:hypothetical protein D3C80_1799470 [compost metagenome]
MSIIFLGKLFLNSLDTCKNGAVPIPPATNATLPKSSSVVNPFPKGPVTFIVCPALRVEYSLVPFPTTAYKKVATPSSHSHKDIGLGSKVPP